MSDNILSTLITLSPGTTHCQNAKHREVAHNDKLDWQADRGGK